MADAEVTPRRILLGAFGDPGHAFPMIALGRALVARGHEVTLQTWTRWRENVEAEGMTFAAAPEYQVFPQGPEPLNFYEAVVQATRDTIPLVRELQARSGRRGHPDARTGSGGRERGRPLGDADPPRLPRWGARLPDLLDGSPAAEHGAGAEHLAPCPADRRPGPRAGSGRAQRNAGTAGPGAARPRPRGDQPAAGAGGHLPPARVSARLARARPRRGTPDVGATHRGC